MARWDEVNREALRTSAPVPMSGRDAKYEWLQRISKSSLHATSRLLAHTLCLHGRKDGSRIYPSVQTLAEESGLSERTVCDHLDRLILAGYLSREAKQLSGREWAAARYGLCVPKAALELSDQNTPAPNCDPSLASRRGVFGTEPASVRRSVNGTERRSAPQRFEALNGTPEALKLAPRGTESGGIEALSEAQPSLRSESKDLALGGSGAAIDKLLPDGADRQAVQDWTEHRTAKGKPLRGHEIIALGKVLAVMGDAEVQRRTVMHCIASGWMNIRHSDAANGKAAPVRNWRPGLEDDGV